MSDFEFIIKRKVMNLETEIRCDWAQLGDKNTEFSHYLARARQ